MGFSRALHRQRHEFAPRHHSVQLCLSPSFPFILEAGKGCVCVCVGVGEQTGRARLLGAFSITNPFVKTPALISHLKCRSSFSNSPQQNNKMVPAHVFLVRGKKSKGGEGEGIICHFTRNKCGGMFQRRIAQRHLNQDGFSHILFRVLESELLFSFFPLPPPGVAQALPPSPPPLQASIMFTCCQRNLCVEMAGTLPLKHGHTLSVSPEGPLKRQSQGKDQGKRTGGGRIVSPSNPVNLL